MISFVQSLTLLLKRIGTFCILRYDPRGLFNSADKGSTPI